jgi:hypothetical protein
MYRPRFIDSDAIGFYRFRWRHIEMLHETQKTEGLTLGNKLTGAHVNFKNQKMKVRLAVQVLSASCSKALEYLRKNGHAGFFDSEPTEILLQKLDKLFDILNSKSTFGKGYKKAFTSLNIDVRLQYMRETKQFLLPLKDSNGCRLSTASERLSLLDFV